MEKKFKQSKLTGFDEEQLKGYLVNLDKDINNLFQLANSLPGISGTTGGTGTAGAGKQYIGMKIKGVNYKILHDGTY